MRRQRPQGHLGPPYEQNGTEKCHPGGSDVAPGPGALCQGEVWREISADYGKGEVDIDRPPHIRNAVQLEVVMSCSPRP